MIFKRTLEKQITSSNLVKKQEKSCKTKKQYSSSEQIKQYQNLSKKINKKNQKLNSGHWTTSENARYIVFITYHKNIFEQNSQRKIWRIFKQMSNFIDTRNYIQCRSHHQKMIQQYQSIEKYIQLKSSNYNSQALDNVKNQLLSIKTKSKCKNIDEENRTIALQPSLIKQIEADNLPLLIQKNSLSLNFNPQMHGYMNYHCFNPWFSNQFPYVYPFYWN